ncbi:Uncharacterised protein [Cedecea neteri]|uniref:Uncharacterized protein n=1 Tax=Cedecea neteri TaxID=158822 RepID=A0A2X3JAJ4_9ENTR|nr:Uncharacterised protein [Cedecea neteri]
MVGVDPALVLCYRDEYKQTLGEERGDFQVQLVHEWLQTALKEREVQGAGGRSMVPLWPLYRSDGVAGGTESVAGIFARFGAKLESVSVGCCGMAGTYGHEVKNLANSLGIYELSLASGDAAPAAQPLSGNWLLLP